MQTVSGGTATMSEGPLSLSRLGGAVSMRCAIFIGYRIHVSDKNSTCWVTVRHKTVSGGDVKHVYFAIATLPISHSRTLLPDSVSGPLCH